MSEPTSRMVSAVATGCALTTLLAVSSVLPSSALAQADAQAPVLTPQEAEAHQMSLTLGGSCNPRRHNQMVDSESVIERAQDPLVGTAAFYSSFEGTFLVLEAYDESFYGHCLVFGWFGGPLEPGSYRVSRLSQSTVQAELEAEDHSFYSMSAIRNAVENSVFVIESGTLEIVDLDEETMSGDFDVSGFLIDGGARTDGVAWSGSFRAEDGS